MTEIIQSTQTNRQAQDLKNRLIKRFKHLNKWAKRRNVLCFRLYDRDIPEIPLAIDIYKTVDLEQKLFAHIALYERPYEKDESEENMWLAQMKEATKEALLLEDQNIIIKTRKKQRGETSQYTKFSDEQKIIYTGENGATFKINLTDYLDTGLFFDHRPLRQTVKETAQNKDVLNLFCYTGSFSVYAALGGAKSVDSVDLSKNYLNWAKENMNLNAIDTTEKDSLGVEKYRFIAEDCVSFIKWAAKAKNAQRNKWDIIVLDPPTFSNSKKIEGVFDINNDWKDLVNTCLLLLKDGGVLYFSTNSRKLKFDETQIDGIVTEITESTIPEDFKSKAEHYCHRCWKILNKN